jgi:SAM-dependent methyltransferase
VRVILPYPGESPSKRLARVRLYRRVDDLFQAGGTPDGWVVVLAGKQACELWILRHFLQWDPSRVLFVDIDPAGPKRAFLEWPDANIYVGDLIDVLPELDSIAFANLDFCGLPTQQVQRCVREVGKRLSPGGIVSYTFPRGRENQQSLRHWSPAFAMADEYAEDQGIALSSSDDRRFLGYTLLLEQLLGKRSLHAALALKYRNNQVRGLSMGSVALQWMPRKKQTREWRQAIELDPYSGKIDPKQSDEELREHFEDLSQRVGLRDAVASLTLHV